MEQATAPRRAGALVAVGTMALIAVVVAGGVVLWGRLAAREAGAAVASPEEVPAALADGEPPGEVPAVVADAVQGPVVGVRRVTSTPPEFAGCGGPAQGDEDLEYAFVTPDGLSASWVVDAEAFGVEKGFAGPAPTPDDQRMRVTCHGTLQDGGWAVVNGMTGPVDGGFTGVEPASDDLVRAAVRVPEDADWVVHDRGGYRLAYDVTDLTQVHVTIPVRAGGQDAAPLTFLTAAGEVVDETSIGL